MRPRIALFFLLFVVILLTAAQSTSWAQCIMCKTALESSVEGRALASSLRAGILLLMGAPYVMLGSIGYVIFRAFQKKKDPEA
jgi:hypothetical protein